MNTEQTDLLHVASIGKSNGATTAEQEKSAATVLAIEKQQPSLKALAMLTLERNKARNKRATLATTAPSVACVAFPKACNTQQVENSARPLRAIVAFRLSTDPLNAWASALGGPGLPATDVIDDLRERYGGRVVIGEVREAAP